MFSEEWFCIQIQSSSLTDGKATSSTPWDSEPSFRFSTTIWTKDSSCWQLVFSGNTDLLAGGIFQKLHHPGINFKDPQRLDFEGKTRGAPKEIFERTGSARGVNRVGNDQERLQPFEIEGPYDKCASAKSTS